MNMRIIEELGQYLPMNGKLLDIGCGFGLFSLYFALESSSRTIVGYDISENRLDMARKAATTLGVSRRTSFCRQDASGLCESPGTYQAVYMLDILHHVDPTLHGKIISAIHDALVPGGVLVLKEIDTRPHWKVWFTWILDILMSPSQPPRYVSKKTLSSLLASVGFEVRTHALVDILPYPHILYVCRKVL
jgi:2-polyprenyl-3-methyl-5-hydroxy-6-metoxy-1,4-benzoquinol methylase